MYKGPASISRLTKTENRKAQPRSPAPRRRAARSSAGPLSVVSVIASPLPVAVPEGRSLVREWETVG